MPTVLRIDGLRFVIYPNDHAPAHVHVIVPGGGAVVVDLKTLKVREYIRCNATLARRVLSIEVDYESELLVAWRRFHG